MSARRLATLERGFRLYLIGGSLWYGLGWRFRGWIYEIAIRNPKYRGLRKQGW